MRVQSVLECWCVVGNVDGYVVVPYNSGEVTRKWHGYRQQNRGDDRRLGRIDML